MPLNRPVVTRYHIEAKGRFASRPLRIVHLSDLHSTLYGPDQQALIGIVRDESPDLIALTGDMFDIRRSHRGAMLLLRGIRDLAPLYFVTGNHEYDPGIYDRLELWFRRLGVTLLGDRWVSSEVRGERVLVAGVSDPARRLISYRYDQAAAMERCFGALGEEEGLRMLLTHRPECIRQYLNYPFDLILAGHAHGGQARIPFTRRGLFAPHQGFFPPYTRGVYRFGETQMVVSCGLSRFAGLPRILNPPEVVVITISG